MDKIRQILQQSPEGVEEEQIKKLLKIYEDDSVKVLTYLWDIKENNEVEENQDKKKWDNIREICNSYEEEMENFMKSKKNI